MMKSSFIVVVGLLTGSAALAKQCIYPDDGRDLLINNDCPLFDWSLTGSRPSIPDHGEFLWVDDLGRVHVTLKLTEVPEPFRTMYRSGTRLPDGSLTFPTPRAHHSAISAENAVQWAYAPRAMAVAQARDRRNYDLARIQTELYDATRALLEAAIRPSVLATTPLDFALPALSYGPQLTKVRTLVDARERVLMVRNALEILKNR